MKIDLKSLVMLLAAGSLLIAAEVPRPAPEFVIKTMSGQQLLLSQYRGKVIALEFLLTTCPHCQATSRLMTRLYKEYGSRGFQPLGVAFDDRASLLAPEFIRSNQVEHPIGVAARDAVFTFLQLSPIVRTSVPLLVFIDRNGVIRAQYAGDAPFLADEEKNMRATIESLLREPAGVKKATRRKAGSSGAVR